MRNFLAATGIGVWCALLGAALTWLALKMLDEDDNLRKWAWR